MKRKTPLKFVYEAYDKKGIVVRGVVSMYGKGEVLSHLLSQGLKPIHIEVSVENKGVLGTHLFERIRIEDILFFSRNLATTLRMGVPATESLELIMSDIDNEKMRVMLRDVLESVRSGNSFSESFRKHEKYFPHMFIGMLEAGELSGNLDATLTTFADYLDRSHAFKGRVRSALLYPSILAVVSIAVSLLVIMMLIPRLSNLFSEVNIVLPAVTRALITVSEILTFNYLLDLGVIILCVMLFIWFRSTKTGKNIFSRLAIQAPGARDLVRKTILVRITRTLGTMLASGVPITTAMELAGKSGGNEQFSSAVSRVSEHINSGTAVSSAFSDESNFFPRLLVGLISVGERTGKLSDTLLSIADFYERDVDERLKRFSSLLEPILLLVIGLVVGAIALAVLLPVYQLVGTVR